VSLTDSRPGTSGDVGGDGPPAARRSQVLFDDGRGRREEDRRLASVLRPTLRRWWIVLLSTVFAVGLAFAYEQAAHPIQRSCARVQVIPVLTGAVSPDTPARRYVAMDDELVIAEGSSVRATASAAVRSDLTGRYEVFVPANSQVLRLCGLDRSGRAAEEIATALSNAFVAVRQAQAAATLAAQDKAAQTDVKAQQAALDALSKLAVGRFATDAVKEQINQAQTGVRAAQDQLSPIEAASPTAARVVSAATPALTDATLHRQALVSSLAVGLLVGIGLTRLPSRSSAKQATSHRNDR